MEGSGREGKGREGKGREWKGREGKGRISSATHQVWDVKSNSHLSEDFEVGIVLELDGVLSLAGSAQSLLLLPPDVDFSPSLYCSSSSSTGYSARMEARVSQASRKLMVVLLERQAPPSEFRWL